MESIKSLEGLKKAKPANINFNSFHAVTESLSCGDAQMTVLRASSSTLSINDWIVRNKTLVESLFYDQGAILFRNFNVEKPEQFVSFTKVLSTQLLDYQEPSTPRTKVSDKLYTSTEYPPELSIPLHNEHSYGAAWPMRIWFYCHTPAQAGGQTPLADSRKVFSMIDSDLRNKFASNGVLYVRNYNPEFDLNWQDVFGSNDRKAVEQYCKLHGLQFEWMGSDNLRTKRLCKAVELHPKTKETVWFNQAHLFHISSLGKDVAKLLLDEYNYEDLPRNAYYGDGSIIEDDVIQHIHDVYARAQFSFDWQKGDIVMLDNMLFAHGRNPFQGERKVLVSMAESAQSTIISPTNKNAVSRTRSNTAIYFLNNDDDENIDIVKYKLAVAYRILAMEGLDEGISGHITFRDLLDKNSFYVNPFGLTFEEVTPENLIMVNRNGEVIQGDYPVNVTGFCIHANIHEIRKDVNCIAHTHSPWGTVFSSLNRKLLALDQNSSMFKNNHGLYSEYNGPVYNMDDAENLTASLGENDALVLCNHGLITCGDSIEKATVLMIALERACRLNVLTKPFSPVAELSDTVCEQTKEWISNPIGLKIEFNALMRKAEARYPDLLKFKKTS